MKTSDWDERPSLGVVLAAGGYPADYRQGDVIHGLPQQEVKDGKVFHAGTKLNGIMKLSPMVAASCVSLHSVKPSRRRNNMPIS